MGGEWSASLSMSSTRGERAPGTHLDRLGSRVGLGVVVSREILVSDWNRTLLIQSVACQYADCCVLVQQQTFRFWRQPHYVFVCIVSLKQIHSKPLRVVLNSTGKEEGTMKVER
jgi:hypothetical protein